jgi:hypothetical protein
MVVIRLPGHVKDDAQDVLVEQVHSQFNATLAPFSLTLELYGTYGRWHETPSMPPVWRRSFVFGPHQQQGSTSMRGNERATIKALPATPHHPRPYGNRISPRRMESGNSRMLLSLSSQHGGNALASGNRSIAIKW